MHVSTKYRLCYIMWESRMHATLESLYNLQHNKDPDGTHTKKEALSKSLQNNMKPFFLNITL